MGAMAVVDDIRRAVNTDVFDYQQLMDCLRSYAKPRDKIRAMLKAGEIIRVKKGIYVFGANHRRGPWSRETLANLIYGPSYISLEYALSYYGFIPERVVVVTSVTLSRSRRFETPVGWFTYRSLSRRKYSIGIDQHTLEAGQHFLMATPAKALADKIWTDHRFTPRRRTDIHAYLQEDLRIDSKALNGIDRMLLRRIAQQYGSRKIRLLCDYLCQAEDTGQ
jgi:predicted transcriptional regulator of viral defense system